MGKKQHQKDKLYLTCTEWSTLYGGKKAAAEAKAGRSEFKRLPFSCCSLSLQPFEHPLCTPEGVVFDLLSIVPYLKKYGLSPVTGKKMEAKDLIKLHFHKNNEDMYHCPVTFRVFNENSHIVAIRTSGNVYSYEAVERLNLKTKLLKDLITDEPFKKTDIITIQDPTKLEKFDISMFHHIKNNVSITEEEIQKAMKNPTYHLRTINSEAKAALEGLYQEYKVPEKKDETKEKATSRNAAHYSTGAVSQSFTSTVSEVATENEAAILDRDVVRYRKVKKKGYVRLQTNLGDLNLELHCELVPKTCENFILLCQRNYYNNTKFHRSIKHFMIQGGDPTGTGRGGESAWNREFIDEFKPNLSHTGRGILSMANSGPDTNGSQFFVTFRSCTHLDRKHTIFGRLVGGLEVLTKMERVPTNDEDVPQDDIVITGTTIFVNPFEEVDKELNEEEQIEIQTQLEPTKEIISDRPTKTYRKGIGKYIQPVSKATPTNSQSIAGIKRPSVQDMSTDEVGPSKRPALSIKKKPSEKFKDFSSW